MTPAAAILLLVMAEPGPAGEMASRPRVASGVNGAVPARPGDCSGHAAAPHLRAARTSAVARDASHGRPRQGLAARSPLPSIATMLAALGLVLGLFLVTIWACGAGMPAGPRLLPSEVVEVLGRVPLAGRQHAHLVRCGNKLLLLACRPAGVETLTEITDPLEVDRLAGLCQQANPHSASTAFRQVFQQFGQKPARGFLERRARATCNWPAKDLMTEPSDGGGRSWLNFRSNHCKCGSRMPRLLALAVVVLVVAALPAGRKTCRTARPGSNCPVRSQRRSAGMDQSRRLEFDVAGDVAADGAEPGRPCC